MVNAERPGSPQIVLEPDVELTELVRRELPLPRQHRIRVLRSSGTMLLNLADEPGMAHVRRAYAGLVTVFGHAALIGTHDVLKGKRFGNTVAIASSSPLDIAALRRPVPTCADLCRQVAKSSFPTGLRDGIQLARQSAGSTAFTTADSAQSPPPPPVKGWRVR
ncbi:MAG: hypothetical protein ACYDDU_04875 [Dermatophilaceae bacterium]